MTDEFVVNTIDEKVLIDYLNLNIKLQDWKRVATIATDLVELKATLKFKKKELSADGGVVDDDFPELTKLPDKAIGN